jgi:hypothetical protein
MLLTWPTVMLDRSPRSTALFHTTPGGGRGGGGGGACCGCRGWRCGRDKASRGRLMQVQGSTGARRAVSQQNKHVLFVCVVGGCGEGGGCFAGTARPAQPHTAQPSTKTRQQQPHCRAAAVVAGCARRVRTHMRALAGRQQRRVYDTRACPQAAAAAAHPPPKRVAQARLHMQNPPAPAKQQQRPDGRATRGSMPACACARASARAHTGHSPARASRQLARAHALTGTKHAAAAPAAPTAWHNGICSRRATADGANRVAGGQQQRPSARVMQQLPASAGGCDRRRSLHSWHAPAPARTRTRAQGSRRCTPTWRRVGENTAHPPLLPPTRTQPSLRHAAQWDTAAALTRHPVLWCAYYRTRSGLPRPTAPHCRTHPVCEIHVPHHHRAGRNPHADGRVRVPVA